VEVNTPAPIAEPSLEDRKFEAETSAKKQELALKEREVAAKEEELRRSRWLNPTVIGLFAAALGLMGSVIVARVNNQASQQLEKFRSQSNLILQAIKTDKEGACKNLVFFVNLQLLDDTNHAISKACSSGREGAPSLPVETSFRVPRLTVSLFGKDATELQSLRVYCQSRISALTHSGVIAFPTLGSPTSMALAPGVYMIWAAKDGDPSTPVSNKIDADVSESDIRLVLQIP
jgi:hypothetical protein